MRLLFLLILLAASWVFWENSRCGNQRTGEQGILILGVVCRMEMPFLKFSDLIVPNNPTQHAFPHGSDADSLMAPYAADEMVTTKNELRVLLINDVVSSIWSERGAKSQALSADESATNENVKVANNLAGRTLLHVNNPVLLDEKRWWVRSHNSSLDTVKWTSVNKQPIVGMAVHSSIPVLSDTFRLGTEGHIFRLEVVAGTATDKQANAVRRHGVDSALLKYAGLTLSGEMRTGVIYDVALPPSLAGIQAQATRLDPATLRQTGLSFNEFILPPGVSFDPRSTFVTVVYRKISNFVVYTLPPEYEFGGPVVGIISSPSNSTFLDPSLPRASILLSDNILIKINLPMFSSNLIPNALCAFLASNGSIFVTNLTSLPNTCVSSTLGDFALVVQASSTPSPLQSPPPPPPAATASPSTSSTTSKPIKNWKLIVGVTCLALGGLAFLVALVLITIKFADSFKLFFTNRFTENEEALQNSLIGDSKAPSASVMRTKPALEIDMAHFTNSLAH